MFVQFKNNGFWVPVCLFISFILAVFSGGGLQSIVPSSFDRSVLNLCFALAFLGCGFFMKYLDEDYIIDENGVKHYMEFDNKFMFISMKLWVYICWIISGIATIGALGTFVEALIK